MQHNFLTIVIALMIFCGMSPRVACCQENTFKHNAKIEAVRDSLDAIQYKVPDVPVWEPRKIINISTQDHWDGLKDILKASLDHGDRAIEVRLTNKDIVLGNNNIVIQGFNYPNAKIRVVGSGAPINPYGISFVRKGRGSKLGFYSYTYKEFNLDDTILDESGNEISLREEAKQVTGEILKVQGLMSSSVQDDIWKFKIDLPDLNEKQCKDFYILMTRDWTSARHKVVKVENGWLYYHLYSTDWNSNRNPNVDWTLYKVRPRYRLINCPMSNGLHIVDGRIYIPPKYKKVKIVKGGSLLTFSYCHFNTLEVTGFKLNGSGQGALFGIYSSTFDNGAFIRGNEFRNLSSKAVCTANNRNVAICDNVITDTRQQAIEGGGVNTTICRNRLKNIGWMLNTRAVSGSGDKLHICDNVIEDFNYAAIACGSRAATKDSVILNFIIERNYVHLTKNFTDNFLSNTLADGGGIFFGPSCTQGIIRDNIIVGMKGINSNRGIFLDDGSKNVSIYGNMIVGTINSYDIDLRLCSTFAKEIPDYNTNNSIFHNIMTGGYRFQDRGADSHCVGGQNILVLSGRRGDTIVDIENFTSDITIDGVEFDGKIQIQKRQSYLLSNLNMSNFVRGAIEVN